MTRINLAPRQWEIYWQAPHTGFVSVYRRFDDYREARACLARLNYGPGCDERIREVRS